MEKYHSINSIFKRDEDGNFTDEFAQEEFEYLKSNIWRFEEKVDGRNHRVMKIDDEIRHRGRTDNAQFHPDHLTYVTKLFDDAPMQETFGHTDVCLYGELYGEGIQGGGKYIDGVDFVLFDVKIDGYWLKRRDVEDIASKLGINVVPVVQYGTIEEAIDIVKEGFYSNWNDKKHFLAEGLVLKPETQLFNRMGERIITKVKHEDFK